MFFKKNSDPEKGQKLKKIKIINKRKNKPSK